MTTPKHLADIAASMGEAFQNVASEWEAELAIQEIGTVSSVSDGVAFVSGLPRARSEEVLRFTGGRAGIAFNLEPDQIGVVMLDDHTDIDTGSEVRRTGHVVDIPVGPKLLGRVIDPQGRPLDGRGAVETDGRLPTERDAPAIMDRDPVKTPLQTGIKAVDAVIPIGRGQRELILGDRQTGKTAVVIDTIINQRDTDVRCVYCAVGQRTSAVAKAIADLEEHGALEYTAVVVATGSDPAGMRFIAPYAAMSIAEYFRDRGEDALVVFDDLTRHARAYRELSLLLRRPPGREAYPGDIFYIHARLLERATRMRADLGGGTITALPIIETQEQNISAYIPTNLISITDGQIYLSPELFQEGVLPAIDVSDSVSRVGGDAQLPVLADLAGDLRLAYSQFEELEAFTRFGSRLDEETQRRLQHGRHAREALEQPQYEPMRVCDQAGVLIALNEGLLDDIPLERTSEAEARIIDRIHDRLPDLCDAMESGAELDEEERARLLDELRQAVGEVENGQS